jgi:hypothetical protein
MAAIKEAEAFEVCPVLLVRSSEAIKRNSWVVTDCLNKQTSHLRINAMMISLHIFRIIGRNGNVSASIIGRFSFIITMNPSLLNAR